MALTDDQQRRTIYMRSYAGFKQKSAPNVSDVQASLPFSKYYYGAQNKLLPMGRLAPVEG